MPANLPFNNIGIAGLGLIGGSFAKAFAEEGIGIYGYDINASIIQEAAISNIFEGLTDELESFLQFPLDLIYICLPIKASISFIGKLSQFNISIPVTDAASTKTSVIKAAYEAKLDFCGGHPIAGKETSGFSNSEKDLFKNTKHILIPQGNETLTKRLFDLHKSIGMNITTMDAESHDEILALVSHLPHLAAFCLMDAVAEKRSEALNFAGGGFRDFTRIAAGDPIMWADIFTDNKDALINGISDLEKSIQKWKKLIEKNDYDELKQNISIVSNKRRLL